MIYSLIYNRLIVKSEDKMKNVFKDEITNSLKQKFANDHSSIQFNLQNYHEGSKAFLNLFISIESSKTTNNNLLAEISNKNQQKALLSYFQTSQQDSYFNLDEQTPFRVPSFEKCYSELYEPIGLEFSSSKIKQPCLSFKQSQSGVVKQNRSLEQQSDSRISPDLSGQEFKSNSINSQSDIKQIKIDGPYPLQKGLLAKNVTKNIGKLLFKFIWKNRNHLKKTLRIDSQLWENFLKMIKVCKKQNNITRQFLLEKWHSFGDVFKLFRIIAHHFFRKHCLPAIYRSKIRLKRIHFQLITKFDQALVNPRSLDYLS